MATAIVVVGFVPQVWAEIGVDWQLTSRQQSSAPNRNLGLKPNTEFASVAADIWLQCIGNFEQWLNGGSTRVLPRQYIFVIGSGKLQLYDKANHHLSLSYAIQELSRTKITAELQFGGQSGNRFDIDRITGNYTESLITAAGGIVGTGSGTCSPIGPQTLAQPKF
jgi:hypothetical protein